MLRNSILMVLLALGCADVAHDPGEDLDPQILGRWDVTVHAEESYPSWFELVEQDGELSGRFQGRVGHALELERVEADGATLSMTSDGIVYEGELAQDRWTGSGRGGDGVTFEWTATRAPELPAPANVRRGDPIELFNGRDLAGWKARDPSRMSYWKAEDGVLVNEGAGSDLVTEEDFDDFRLHVEVNVPEGSNSGIYLRGRYEVQVQDDFGKEPHSLRMGGVYGQVTPTENAARPAGEWQSFDITLLGRFVTVVLNGTTIIDDREIPGITGGALDSSEGEPGPIFLQGDHGRILYRNLILTPLNR